MAAQSRVLVLSSTGKHFSAGMALDVFSGGIQMDDQSPEGRAAMLDTLGALQATFTKLESLRIPVLAAIQGGCIGGAVDMVTACCMRYATADAFFCIQEINIGMVADVGTLQRLPKLIPEAVAKELAYTGRRLPAARALALGLVNEVFDSPRGDAGRRDADRPRDRRQAAGRDLGHQAGHPLHARPFGGRRAAADGLAARRHLEQPPCARGRHRHEGKTRRRLSRPGARCSVSRTWAAERRPAAVRQADHACRGTPAAGPRYCRAVRTLRGNACGALVRNGLMSSPPRRV